MSNNSWESIGDELNNILSDTDYQLKIRKMKQTTLLILAVIGAMIIWFIGARWVFRGITNADEKEAKEAMVSDCGCSSIDECLNQNKLDCAWKMYEADDIKIYPYPDLIKLIKAQCALHIQKEEYQQGWDYIKKQDFDVKAGVDPNPTFLRVALDSEVVIPHLFFIQVDAKLPLSVLTGPHRLRGGGCLGRHNREYDRRRQARPLLKPGRISHAAAPGGA